MENLPVKKWKVLGFITTFLVLSTLPMISLAQTTFDVDSSGHGGGGDITDVPLDGGTVFLIAAGVAFGVYKLYKMTQLKTA